MDDRKNMNIPKDFDELLEHCKIGDIGKVICPVCKYSYFCSENNRKYRYSASVLHRNMGFKILTWKIGRT